VACCRWRWALIQIVCRLDERLSSAARGRQMPQGFSCQKAVSALPCRCSSHPPASHACVASDPGPHRHRRHSRHTCEGKGGIRGGRKSKSMVVGRPWAQISRRGRGRGAASVCDSRPLAACTIQPCRPSPTPPRLNAPAPTACAAPPPPARAGPPPPRWSVPPGRPPR
jgi:hypothetical protein